MHQRGADLLKLLVNLSDRTARKLAAQREELRASTEREKLKIYGDLINSNLYALEKGMPFAELENYYEEGAPKVRIPLDPMLTPSQNAQRYFKLYQKARSAKRLAAEQVEKTTEELDYLEGQMLNLSACEEESELAELREKIAYYKQILADENLLKQVIKEELQEIKKIGRASCRERV